jgi:hypothetical protein
MPENTGLFKLENRPSASGSQGRSSFGSAKGRRTFSLYSVSVPLFGRRHLTVALRSLHVA